RAAAHLRERLPGERLADLIDRADVAGRVSTGGLADGRLIDHHHLFNLRMAGDAAVLAGLFGRFVLEPKQAAIENVLDERGIARAADTGDANQPVERDLDVDGLEIVFGGGADAERMGEWARRRDGDFPFSPF